MKIRKDKKIITANTVITDLNIQRIRKSIIEETDPDHVDEVDDFLKRYRDDTLTGL